MVNRQGKQRLAKWYSTYSLKERSKILKEVSVLILSRYFSNKNIFLCPFISESYFLFIRAVNACNFIEWQQYRIVYRRYVFFILFYFICWKWKNTERKKERKKNENKRINENNEQMEIMNKLKKKKSQNTRYASLYFVLCLDVEDNELIGLEVIHRYCVVLDKFFTNMTE
jgi:predicted membrane protein